LIIPVMFANNVHPELSFQKCPLKGQDLSDVLIQVFIMSISTCEAVPHHFPA
jgi:hypothetical protein